MGRFLARPKGPGSPGSRAGSPGRPQQRGPGPSAEAAGEDGNVLRQSCSIAGWRLPGSAVSGSSSWSSSVVPPVGVTVVHEILTGRDPGRTRPVRLRAQHAASSRARCSRSFTAPMSAPTTVAIVDRSISSYSAKISASRWSKAWRRADRAAHDSARLPPARSCSSRPRLRARARTSWGPSCGRSTEARLLGVGGGSGCGPPRRGTSQPGASALVAARILEQAREAGVRDIAGGLRQPVTR